MGASKDTAHLGSKAFMEFLEGHKGAGLLCLGVREGCAFLQLGPLSIWYDAIGESSSAKGPERSRGYLACSGQTKFACT
jgi:hypothetical protein